MDSLPSKRRKLSPTVSVAVNASAPRDRPVTREGQQTTPSRASFLSPTKASLARFNPSLLPRPKSAGSGAQRRESLRPDGSNTPSRGLNPVALRTTTPPGSPDSNVAARIRTSTASPRRKLQSLGEGLRAAPRRRSRTPGRQTSPATLVRSSATPNLPESLTRAMEESEEVVQNTLDEQLELELQASATKQSNRAASSQGQRGRTVQSRDGEPELPLTPTQLGLEPAAEPPRGLLYSSPLRRAGKRKSSGIKSSPLKPRELASQSSDLGQRDKQPHSLTTDARDPIENGTTVDNPEELRKKETLDRLVNQLNGLRGDVVQLERDLGGSGGGSQEEADGLLSIVLSTNPSHKQDVPSTKSIPLSARLSLFLPFSKPPPPRKEPTPTSESPVPSYKPLQLEDPMPYLQVFTPLTVISVDTLVPSSSSDEPLLQHHDITLSSPKELLKVELRLSVNTNNQAVDSLALITISPWADLELGRWARKVVTTGDIASVGWACGRYWDVAATRARCWNRCCAAFPNLLSTLLLNENVRTLGVGPGKVPFPKQRGRKRKEDVAGGDDDGSNSERESEGDLQSDPEIPRSSILKHLGRQSLLFTRSGVSILISWSIDFDWTGEAESHVSATASFPQSWRNADERASLGKIGGVFDRLVRERGVFEAVKVVVVLLFEG
ncbi:hypothetical protein MMC30_008176 [Trapelia coarctata]|nr:hypothetical protein [Trapelia coarctata]